MSRFNEVKEIYARLGVDAEKAIEIVKNIPIAMHCWQGDDVIGFDSIGELTGGIQTTGNYPGVDSCPKKALAYRFGIERGKK